MSEPKKKKDKSENYVKTFRHGAIAANIFRRQSPSGYQYLDFSLSRLWKTKQSGKEGYSSSFFDNNAQDLHAAIYDAASFIRAQLQQSTESPSVADTAHPANGTPAVGQAA